MRSQPCCRRCPPRSSKSAPRRCWRCEALEGALTLLQRIEESEERLAQLVSEAEPPELTKVVVNTFDS